jgi:hypothetical protein
MSVVENASSKIRISGLVLGAHDGFALQNH